MKYLIFVLSIIVSSMATGCAGWSKIPTAGVYVTNNVEGTRMVVSSTRDYVLNPVIRTGDRAFVPVGGYPGGNEFTISAKVYSAEDGVYLGVAERREWISFDSSDRYGNTWIISSYRATSPAPRRAATQARPVPPPPPPGKLKVTNNIEGVGIVLSSSEDEDKMLPMMTKGNSASITVGQDPATRRFVITAKVYSPKGEYLGFTEYRGSIDERRGFGNDRTWVISSYTKVQRSYEKDKEKDLAKKR